MQNYLESSEYIDWQTDNVSAKAKQLAHGLNDSIDTAAACFEFVRDHIKHTS